MTTITLEVPDELAVRLNGVREQIPWLLSTALDLQRGGSTAPAPSQRSSNAAFEELIEFLARSPTAQDILSFKVSAQTQDRIDELLDRKSAGELTGEETAELDTYRQLHHVFILLKARARSVTAPR